MQLEQNKEYETKNNCIARIRMIESDLAYAEILGTKIDESERQRIYTIEGKDFNDKREYDIVQEYQSDSSYLQHPDMSKRLELNNEIDKMKVKEFMDEFIPYFMKRAYDKVTNDQSELAREDNTTE